MVCACSRSSLMMRKISGRKWGGETEEGEDEEEENEEEEHEERAEESLEYSEWIRSLTRELEERVEKGGAGTKWEEEAVRRKVGWTGHMLRRGPERRTARMLEAEERGRKRKKQGVPVRRWADSFTRVLGGGWQQEAQDRSQWKFWQKIAVEEVGILLAKKRCT